MGARLEEGWQSRPEEKDDINSRKKERWPHWDLLWSANAKNFTITPPHVFHLL